MWFKKFRHNKLIKGAINMETTSYKVGDKVKVETAKCGTPRTLIGKTFTITWASYNGAGAMTSDYYNGNPIDGTDKISTIYHGDLVPAFISRKEHAEYLKTEIDDMKESIKLKEKEVEILLKYKDEEEELAAKISEILKNKNDVVAIAKILRGHKTDLL
jgi:hypothetical protein